MRFFRYTLVGGIATLVHYIVLVVLVEGAGVGPPLAAALGAAIGAQVGYLGNRSFTFLSHAPHHRAFPRYLLVAAGGALANGSIVWLGTALLDWHYLAAQVLATTLILVGGFALNRTWTFA